MTTRLALALALSLGLSAPAYTLATPTTANAPAANPFFTESTLPLRYPAFDQIADSDSDR